MEHRRPIRSTPRTPAPSANEERENVPWSYLSAEAVPGNFLKAILEPQTMHLLNINVVGNNNANTGMPSAPNLPDPYYLL